MRKALVIAGAAAIVALSAGPALAHVTVRPNEGLAGGFQSFVVSVPNERDNASTIKVEVEFPPVASVSFQDVAGWDRKVEMVEFDEPIEAFGEEITEGVGSVTWSGGEVEPGEFMTFPFSVGPLPSGELEFPALQTYDNGEVVRWIGPPDADEPAAVVNAIDLGLEEGQGQLAALADIRAELGALRADLDHAGSDDNTPLLSMVAAGVAVLALIVALIRKRA